MSRVESRRIEWTRESDERRSRTLAAGMLAASAGFVALWPYTSVISAGRWSFISVAMIIVVTVVGVVVRQLHRRDRTRNLWTPLAQIVAATCAVTMLLLPQGALLGIIPTGATINALGPLVADGFIQVQTSAAPMEDTLGLRTVITLGFAVAMILLDQLVAQRLTLLAVLLIASVGAIPMIVSFGDANIPWFVVLAVLSLFLLRHRIRHDRSAPRRTSVGVVIGVGAAAVVAALVITPILPVSANWVGAGTSLTLNPSLRLGDDLRRPAPTDVITLATDESSAPYLRIATLSRFDGRVWTPDEAPVRSLDDGFGETEWSDSIAAVDQRTSIRINGISSSWLPVPYPATKIVGASSAWNVMLTNRTVVSDNQNAAGEDYTVTSAVVSPSLEQIRAADAVMDAPPEEEVPEIIAATAAEVTAGAETDYDRLVAMQDWFRGQFSYSLDAPVEGDFDGTGSEAVEAFLEARSGYCIHFAGAFALMAQALDMPVRIVVGYLPGRATEDKRGDESIFVVSSDQLHAWPEVRFDGIGWVPFEPTASLGVPTSFQSAETTGGTSTDPTAPAPSAAPTTAPTNGPEVDRDQGGTSTADGEALRGLDPTPVLLVSLGVLVVILLPALTRLIVRTRRRAGARSGDAILAWRELRDTLVDLGLPVSDADTPRMRGVALVDRGADTAAVQLLVSAVERASYARATDETVDLSHAIGRASADLRRSVDGPARLAALFLPRSLFAAGPSRATVLS